MTDVREGDIVAAPFDSDNLWYRAEVSAVEGDRVDLYYGDFGDSCWVSKDRIRRLRFESSSPELFSVLSLVYSLLSRYYCALDVYSCCLGLVVKIFVTWTKLSCVELG